MRKNCIFYAVTQGLSELLTEQEKVDMAGKEDFLSKLFNRKINDEALNNKIVSTERVTDKITEVKLSIPLNYLQTPDQSFYSIRATQYDIPTSH